MRKKLGALPLFPVHDSIVFDVDNLEVIPYLKTEMEKHSMEITGSQIEFVEEIKYGPNWGELKEWKEN
jgi:DNA polymerase I-like protein with 3'-5' exonuclease and polymerase domains